MEKAHVETERSRRKPAWLLGLLAGLGLVGLAYQAIVLMAHERGVQQRLDRLERNLSELRSEVQADSRDPGRAAYMGLRLRAIRAQISELHQGGILLLGDSIMEALLMPDVCGLPTLNAAIGGVGVSSVAQYAQEFLPVTKPLIAVVGVGVNDAAIVIKPPLAEWAARYADILRAVHTAQATPVVINVLPVEKTHPLASQFDSQRIVMMNRELRRLAAQVGGIYVDTDPVFKDAGGFMKAGGTVDGVHPTLESYTLLAGAIRQGIAEALKHGGHPCPASGG
jgi:lysophospholipase L1-like esterase